MMGFHVGRTLLTYSAVSDVEFTGRVIHMQQLVKGMWLSLRSDTGRPDDRGVCNLGGF